jgi:phage-related minor tail protein
MGSAIDKFVRTGKLSMKDFARSVIQDLIAIQMKAAALSFLRMMFAPTMGPSIDGGGALPSSFNQYLAPRASGGPVSANTPYMVGEKGPELFMPSGSGTIIPNGATGQMGGVTNVTNNYINAIDTKSFEDRLLGSSNAIWAANAYANKSLAVNRGRA